MIYGYARVSTAKQAVNGNSLADQEKALKAAGAEQIVSDAFTGTKMDRPAFSNLLDTLKDGDTLMVTKLDRFARTVVEGVSVIRELIERGVTVRILNMGTVENTPTGKVTLSVMMAFAEFERDMIVERTQSGKAEARAKGIRVDGRPKKFNPDKVQRALDRIERGESYKVVAEDTTISKSTLIRAMRERRVTDVEYKMMYVKAEDGKMVKVEQKEEPKQFEANEPKTKMRLTNTKYNPENIDLTKAKTIVIEHPEQEKPKKIKKCKIVYVDPQQNPDHTNTTWSPKKDND